MRDHSKKLFITIVEASGQEDLKGGGMKMDWNSNRIDSRLNLSRESAIFMIQIGLTGRVAN